MVSAAFELRGCYNKYRILPKRLNMSDNDSLYLLGNIVDRDGSIKIVPELRTGIPSVRAEAITAITLSPF